MLQIEQTQTIDYYKLIEAFEFCRNNPTPGIDTITAAVRRVTKDTSLVLTKEQRQRCKSILHSYCYGASPIQSMSILAKYRTP